MGDASTWLDQNLNGGIVVLSVFVQVPSISQMTFEEDLIGYV